MASRVGRWTLRLLVLAGAALIFETGVVGVPESVFSQVHALSKHNGEWAFRVCVVLLAFVLIALAIGPHRAAAWWRFVRGEKSEATDAATQETEAPFSRGLFGNFLHYANQAADARMRRAAGVDPPTGPDRAPPAPRDEVLTDKGSDLEWRVPLDPQLRKDLERERERGEEGARLVRRERDQLNAPPPAPTSLAATFAPRGISLSSLTLNARTWGQKVKMLLGQKDSLAPHLAQFPEAPPSAHSHPTEGDFERLARYYDAGVRVLVGVLREAA